MAIVIQNTCADALIDEQHLVQTLEQVLIQLDQSDAELLIRLVDEAEIQQLNHTYRHKNQTTNVLSFPSDLPIEIDEAILGDVVICVSVVEKEAKAQNKTFDDHLIHMALHGTLHLLGYDHIKASEAEIMENLEIKILQKMKIANPYA